MISRILSTVAITLALTTQQSDGQYNVKLPHRDVSVEYSENITVFKGAPVYGEPGQPLLPGYKVTFLLPQDINFEDITIQIENPVEQLIRGTFDIQPAQPPSVRGEKNWPSGKNIINGMDMDVYGHDAFFPADYKSAVSFGKLRQYQLVDVTISPFRYNPLTRQLKQITGGTLRLVFPEGVVVPRKNAPADKIKRKKRSGRMEKHLLKKAINPEAIESYDDVTIGTLSKTSSLPQLTSSSIPSPSATTRSLNDGDGYAIITTNQTASSSTMLQNFIDHKSALGYNVILATENIWGGGTGDGAAENMRNWLRNNYLSSDIQYALLIGNPDPASGDVPMKMCWPRFHETVETEKKQAPTDFYYAELSGDWDINNDGYSGVDGDDFGQPGGPDLYAEVSVGRIPFYGSIADLDKILAKSIAYTNETSRGWRKSALLPMIPLDIQTPGYNFGESIRNDILSENNWKSFRLYNKQNFALGRPVLIPEVLKLNPAVDHAPCDMDAVERTWKTNPFGLVTWATHGNATLAEYVLNSSRTANLNNNHPSMVFQVSCLNGYPENQNNLAYSLLKNGAITTVAASRVTLYEYDETDFLNSGTGLGMGYTYSLYVTRDNMTAADALNALKADVVSYLFWMNHLVLNVYGCPDIALDIDNTAPTECRTQALSDSRIRITWTDNSDIEVGYRIERAADHGDFEEIATVAPNVTTYTDNGLWQSYKYHYRVRAYFANGTSDYSNIDSTSTYTNLAAGKMYYASSSQSGYSAEYAVDNKIFTRWASSTNQWPQWYKVDLGGVYDLSGCEMLFEQPGTPGDCYDYVIAVSSDNVTWQNKFSARPNANQSRTQSCFFETAARFVRITFYRAPYYFKASTYEFRVFGQSVPTNPSWNAPIYNPQTEQMQLSWSVSKGAASYTIYQSQPGLPRFAIATGLTSRTYTTSGLIGGKDYIFTVVASNAAGHSDEMKPGVSLEVTAPELPPETPVQLNIAQINMIPGLLLTWSNDTIFTDGIEVERRVINTSSWTVIGTAAAGSLQYLDVTFDHNYSYEYRIRAFNTGGYSAYSEIKNTLLPPPRPTTIYASYNAGNSTISLNWSYGNSTHTGFRLERSIGNGSQEIIATLDPSASSYLETGIADNYTYRYYLCAFNNYGTSNYAEVAVATPPTAPTDLIATLDNPTQVTLRWTDNSFSESGFKIEQAIGNGAFTEIGENYPLVPMSTPITLLPSTTYHFRVFAYSNWTASGYITSEYSNIVTLTTAPPSAPEAPSSLSATANLPNKITLTWTDNSSNESGFYIERATSSTGPFNRIATVSANVRTYASTGLSSATRYWYRVRSYNDGGNSTYSNIATAQTHINLSPAATVSASSQQSGHYATDAKDYNYTTRWAASSATMPQWWKIDFGSVKTISLVQIMFERAGSTGDCNDFRIETSSDNINWTTRVNRSSNTNTAQTQSCYFNTSARYVQVRIYDAPGNYYASMYECKVYGN